LAFQPGKADNRLGRREPAGCGQTMTPGQMRSGSDQRPPRGRYNGNRPVTPSQQRTSRHTQSFDSNGPNIRIRGSARQVFERYVALAREAAIGGDRIAAENLYQHAEHYFRVAGASREGAQQGTAPPTTTPPDAGTDGPGQEPDEKDGERSPPGWEDDPIGFV
jgi:hypothetical protein